MQSPKLIHFTEGGPWHGYLDQPFTQEWAREFAHMLGEDNPCCAGFSEAGKNIFRLEVRYEQKANS